MYDNIQESMECPNKEVIEDDDMLDGWFIIQHKKREKDRVEKEFENSTKNEKIKNAPEVFVVASKEKAEKINDMNDMNAKMIKHQRKLALDRYGSLDEQNLPDQRRNIQAMANNQNRGK
jgi:cation diffusion facilitator CzcD-associated flavoprotein CzcO